MPNKFILTNKKYFSLKKIFFGKKAVWTLLATGLGDIGKHQLKVQVIPLPILLENLGGKQIKSLKIAKTHIRFQVLPTEKLSEEIISENLKKS